MEVKKEMPKGNKVDVTPEVAFKAYVNAWQRDRRASN
jgi:hypothetical protein